MLRFIGRRIAQSLIVLVGVTLVVFSLLHLVQGDPVRVALGTTFNQETYDALRRAAGLDQPLIDQYARYVARAVTGDLGVSFRTGDPVTRMLLDRLPATMSLAIVALGVALVIAFPLGVLAAVRQGTRADHAARIASQVGISIPDFWLAILLILIFSGVLGWLPPSGFVSPFDDVVAWLAHVTMPAVTVGLISGSILTRFVRSAVLEALGADFTRTARAKGLRESTILVRHVLRNAMVPIITVSGIQLASLLGGIVVVEVVFAWPGLGRLTYDAVLARDYTVVQGAVLLVAAIFLVVNLVVDVVYAILDPRIRFG